MSDVVLPVNIHYPTFTCRVHHCSLLEACSRPLHVPGGPWAGPGWAGARLGRKKLSNKWAGLKIWQAGLGTGRNISARAEV